MIDKELLARVRSTLVADMAAEICSVQPIDGSVYQGLINASMSETDLVANGYEPVSDHGLMWIKKESNNGY